MPPKQDLSNREMFAKKVAEGLEYAAQSMQELRKDLDKNGEQIEKVMKIMLEGHEGKSALMERVLLLEEWQKRADKGIEGGWKLKVALIGAATAVISSIISLLANLLK